MKERKGWVVCDNKYGRLSPRSVDIYEEKGKSRFAVTGYGELYYQKNGAVWRADNLNEEWKEPGRFVVRKATLTWEE